jgi:hypothetical protein
MTFFAAMMVAIALAENMAVGQIVGPARRAAAGAAAAAGAPGVGARMENREAARGVTPGDRWRYSNYGNQWWYYTPQNSWMYYQNNAWTPYNATTYRGTVPASPMVPAGYGSDANSWRYVHNGNQWWYYTPQNSWMYYGANSWLPYEAGANNAARYTTGYRGTVGANGNVAVSPPQIPVNPATQDRNASEKPQLGRDAASGQQHQTSDQPQGNQPREQTPPERPRDAQPPQTQQPPQAQQPSQPAEEAPRPTPKS